MTIEMHPIGTFSTTTGFQLQLSSEFVQGLSGIQGFSHVMIIWHANRMPKWEKSHLVIDKPYRLAPEKLGVFATRTPVRPNGICVSIAAVQSIDFENGTIKFYWADMDDGTPVLDIKPYQQCSENVSGARYPDWCAHWPASYEESGSFNWQKEFLFSQ